jgi:hypothetical protein
LPKPKTVEALEFSRADQVLGLSGDEGVVLEVDFEAEDGRLLTGVNGGHAA